jgi:cytochrome d ubiquinol oxidase subunit II
VRHSMITAFGDHPWRLVFPLLVVVGAVGQLVYHQRGQWLHALAASSLFIVGLLTTMAAGLYPSILPARQGRPFGLTIDNAASGHHALTTALFWWPLGMVLAAVYFVFAYRMFFRSERAPRVGNV